MKALPAHNPNVVISALFHQTWNLVFQAPLKVTVLWEV
jgi:hypothetical protein